MLNVPKYFDPKSPDDIATFSFDFTEWLAQTTIDAGADVNITGTPVVTTSDNSLIASGVILNGPLVTFTLSEGNVNTTYTVYCEITTNLGVTIKRSGLVQCIER